jgi:hypothetical protein
MLIYSARASLSFIKEAPVPAADAAETGRNRPALVGTAVAEYRGEKLKTLILQAPFYSTHNYNSQFPITISQSQTKKKLSVFNIHSISVSINPPFLRVDSPLHYYQTSGISLPNS